MRKDKGKKKVIEEDEVEDWCFACKEGGNLLCCDHKGCVKVYHPTCVGKRNSVLKSEGHWTCPRHSCAECSYKTPQFHCLACPDSLCTLCVMAYEFVPVKLNKGLCKSCFEHAMLAEKNAEFDSEGEKLDFQDPGSDDFLFKDYLLLIMEQEKLVFDDFRRAHSKRENYNNVSEYDMIADKDVVISISDVGDNSYYASNYSSGKRKKSRVRERIRSGSKPLIEIPKSVELSTLDEKVNDSRSSSENEEEVIVSDSKSPRTLSSDKVPLKEKAEYAAQKSCYASIVVENINLVYLRRSLVEEMSFHPDNFEERVVGSFVRVRRMSGNCSGTTLFQLMQVTGVKETSNGENKGILLEVSCMPVDIPIDVLNDDDILEEECKDLQRRMKDGLLRKPTIVELEQKAKSLHEDITKSGIRREMVQLQGKIDRMHEKGRRSMWFYTLEQFLDQRERLKNPSELQRRLQKVPRVIEEVIELDATNCWEFSGK